MIKPYTVNRHVTWLVTREASPDCSQEKDFLPDPLTRARRAPGVTIAAAQHLRGQALSWVVELRFQTLP